MRKKILGLVILSFVYIIGFPFFKEHVLDAHAYVTVEPLDAKNDKSKGTEVWIHAILVNGKEKDLGSVLLSGSWENKGRLYHPGKAEDPLHIKFEKGLTLVFIKHPYSGMVKLAHGNEAEIIDLYQKSEEYLYYTVK